MSVKYRITKIEDCKACEGRGIVQHPAWEEYWNDNGSNVNHMTRSDDIKWFRDHNWIEAPGYKNTCDSDGVPHEEMLCRACNGDQVVESQVDLLPVFIEFLSSYLDGQPIK